MKKHLIFLFIMILSMSVYAQSYEIKVYRCLLPLSDFAKISKCVPNDIIERFCSGIHSFKIENKKSYHLNEMQKISEMLKPDPNITQEQKKSFRKQLLAIRNNIKSDIEIGLKISAYCEKITDEKISLMLNFLFREFEGFVEIGNSNYGDLYPAIISANTDSIVLLEMNKPFVLNTYFETTHNNNILVNFFVLIANIMTER